MLRTAAKLTMYHGTAAGSDGQVLRRILKEGLNPNPPKRSFDVQRDKPVAERHYESLGGVYFGVDPWGVTKFSGLAKQKFGGDRVGVVAQIETRGPAITIDEDDLFPLSSRKKIADRFFHAVYRMVEASDYLLLNDMESGTLDYVEMAEWFVDNVIAEQWNISPQEKTAYRTRDRRRSRAAGPDAVGVGIRTLRWSVLERSTSLRTMRSQTIGRRVIRATESRDTASPRGGAARCRFDQRELATKTTQSPRHRTRRLRRR